MRWRRRRRHRRRRCRSPCRLSLKLYLSHCAQVLPALLLLLPLLSLCSPLALRVCRLATAGCCCCVALRCAALFASFSVVLLCAARQLGAASASGTSLELHALPARIREQHFVRVGRSRTLRLKAFAFSLSVPCLPLWPLCFVCFKLHFLYIFFSFLFLTRNTSRFVCFLLSAHLPKIRKKTHKNKTPSDQKTGEIH